MNGHRRGIAVLGAVVLAGTATAVALAGTALQTPQQVTHRRGRQVVPAATPGAAFIAYAQSRRSNPHHFDAYVVPNGGSRVKLNRRGEGWPGGFDGTTLAYQQAYRGQSDIHLYNLTTHKRSTPPGVNTNRWEWQPSISGGWILYGQEWGRSQINDKVILWNHGLSDRRVLDQQSSRRHDPLFPGQVNGDFATWTRWTRRLNVYRYQISTGTTVRVPRPTGTSQYAGTVSNDGTVFYVRSDTPSGTTCGVGVRLHEYDPATQIDTTLAALPAGYDIGVTYTVDEDPGHTVYFDRIRCSTGGSHIFKITAP